MAATEAKAGAAEQASPLDGFINLVQSNKGAAATVIPLVLKAQGIYTFGEILTEPNVQELERSATDKPWLDLLKVFAYGTFAEYKASKERLRLPALTPPQLNKLKLLTLATHASNSKTLPYDLLLRELDFSSVRELEDLLIDAVYAGLVKGKLDQKKGVFEVSFAIGRDIGPSDVDLMISKLNTWLDASSRVTEALETQIKYANEAKANEVKEDEALAAEKKDRIETIKLQQKEDGAAGPGGMAAGLMGNVMGFMGIDPGAKRRTTGRSRFGGGGGGGGRSDGRSWRQ